MLEQSNKIYTIVERPFSYIVHFLQTFCILMILYAW